MNKNNVLLVEDNLSVAAIFKILAKRMGINLVHQTSAERTLELEDTPHAPISLANLIILDFDLVGENTLPILQYIKDNNITTPVIMNSANPSIKDTIDKNGFTDIIKEYKDKNCSLQETQDIILKYIEA